MKIYDISRTITNGLPVWPGDPEVRLEWISRIDRGDSVNLTEIHMCAHSGTHLDMPSHFLEHAQNLDSLDLSILIGNARVVLVPPEVNLIDEAYLKTLSLDGEERILFKTKNCDLVEREPLFFHQNYVALDASGANYLAGTGCKLVGIDYMSIATFDDPNGGHIPLLRAGILVLEGLILQEVPPGNYQLIALPLKLGGREGAPTRALLTNNLN
jgi:arylformamidase